LELLAEHDPDTGRSSATDTSPGTESIGAFFMLCSAWPFGRRLLPLQME
jgi:hypothetical protein